MDFLSTDHLAALTDRIWEVVVTFVPRVMAAALILLIAYWCARRAGNIISNILNRPGHVDPMMRFVAAEFVRYSIIVLALIAALDQIGFRTTSLFAVLGAAGLAIGLALQGTLSNIAAGLMLLWLRPFHIGDYIEVNNVPGLGGTVKQTGFFACQLEAFDGLHLFVPNSTLWNVPLRNFTRNGSRLISLGVTIPQKMPTDAACSKLLELAKADKRVLDNPKPGVFIERINADTVLMNFRVWADYQHIGALQRDLLEAVRAKLAGLGDAGSVQVVRNTPPDSDVTRLQ